MRVIQTWHEHLFFAVNGFVSDDWDHAGFDVADNTVVNQNMRIGYQGPFHGV